jgi:hypothetical protein
MEKRRLSFDVPQETLPLLLPVFRLILFSPFMGFTVRRHLANDLFEPTVKTDFLVHIEDEDLIADTQSDEILTGVLNGSRAWISTIFNPWRGHLNTQRTLGISDLHLIGSGFFIRNETAWGGLCNHSRPKDSRFADPILEMIRVAISDDLKRNGQ